MLLPQLIRIVARNIRNKLFAKKFKPQHKPQKYRGHPAVTRSLIEGLQKLGLSHNYNPSINYLSENVIVLAGARTLRQAISLKKEGIIKKLHAGPNIVEFSTDYDGILTSPEIDTIILNCDWVTKLYIKDSPSIDGKIFIWPAGIDVCLWNSKIETFNAKRILIYEKFNSCFFIPNLIDPYVDFLKQCGWEVDIIRYGYYSQTEYLQALQKSSLMICFSVSESQGLAWAEAWAVNVPTLILKQTKTYHRGRELDNISSAPYLNDETGLFFDNFEHFKAQFSYWESHQEAFSPRRWVLQNMSDEVCAQKLYDMVTTC